jgi:hypothetical protein
MNSIAAMPILVRALGNCPILEMNSIAAVAILVYGHLATAQYWK